MPIRLLFIAVLLFSAGGCGPKAGEEIAAPAASPAPRQRDPRVEALHKSATELSKRAEHGAEEVKVQHLLIAYERAGIPGVTRSLDDAEALAAELWERLGAGEDFDALVKEYTNDSHPGIYSLVARGEGDPDGGVFKRDDMVPAFGETAWRLEVGEIGVALYHPVKSPYGYHIVKRLE